MMFKGGPIHFCVYYIAPLVKLLRHGIFFFKIAEKKDLWGTLKKHPIGLKIESVG